MVVYVTEFYRDERQGSRNELLMKCKPDSLMWENKDYKKKY